MKTVLFVIPDLQIGGVTTSFVNLLKLLKEKNSELDISVLIMNNDSNDYISKTTKIYRLSGRACLWNYSKKSENYRTSLKSLFIGLTKKILNKFSLWNKFCFKKLKISKFDCVIGYKQSPAVLDLVRAINGDTKICFWHGDPNYMQGISSWIYKLSNVDKIACVSFYVKKQMEKLFPKYKNKMFVVLNSVNEDEIKEDSANQNIILSSNVFNLITVSRISNGDKNVFIIPYIASKLKQQDINFKWRIIGDGPDKGEFRKIILSTNTDDVIELIDSKNVYGYIKASNLFVLTSKTESFGLVILESLFLDTPCLCSDLPSVQEIVGQNNGVIYSNNTVDDYCTAIINLLNNKTIFNNLLLKAKSFSYDNQKVYNQFYELINNEAR